MLYHPQSAIRNPQSAIRNPQSAKRKILIGAECKRNRRFFGTTSEARSSKSFEKITEGKTILPTVGTPNKKRYPCIIGFTLIEMMVVIGLIAVVGAWAIPGLKRAYDSFKIAETFDHMTTFRSSFRAYYLIMNEFPGDGYRRQIRKAEVWCIPSSYYTRTLSGGQYYLNITPYQGEMYDIDNWLDIETFAQTRRQFFITLRGSMEWWQRFQDRCGNSAVRYNGNDNGIISTSLSFPEIGGIQGIEEPGPWNRFY